MSWSVEIGLHQAGVAAPTKKVKLTVKPGHTNKIVQKKTDFFFLIPFNRDDLDIYIQISYI